MKIIIISTTTKINEKIKQSDQTFKKQRQNRIKKRIPEKND